MIYSLDNSNSMLWVPGQGTWQGSVTAAGCASGDPRGFLEGACFSALNVSTGVGNPPTGTGFTTSDAAAPLVTRFSLGADGRQGRPSQAVTVNFNQ